MCWPSPGCTWRWWAAGCSGWCARCWRCFPAIALRYPIKKWAAAGGAGGAAFYLLISGAARPAVRAFVMLAMMLLAILLDRPALSMRSAGAGGGDHASAAAREPHRAGIPDVVRRGGEPDRGGGMGTGERERVEPARSRSIALCPGHRADQPGRQPRDPALRDLPFRPRHALRGAGQSAGHAGDGFRGDAGRRAGGDR